MPPRSYANRVYLRFHAELNDHLPPGAGHQTVERTFLVPGSVKDLIESCGVPHTEVSRIVVNGAAVDSAYIIRDGDRIEVYPAFEAPADPRFVLDVHLGKLAAYMRMLGFDTLYRSCFSDAELTRISVEDHRVLLT